MENLEPRGIIGGTVKSASVNTEQTTTSTAYADLTTPGPAVTATIGASGSAIVVVGCQAKSASGNDAFMSFAVSGATTVAASTNNAFASAGTAWHAASRTSVVTGLTAGSNTFTAKYVVGSGTGHFDRRHIIVIPL